MECVKFCLLFNLSPCARYCLLIGSQLTTWSQGNLHYIGLHFFQLDREFFCLLPSLTRLYSAAASPSERLRSDGSLAMRRIILKWPARVRKSNQRWNVLHCSEKMVAAWKNNILREAKDQFDVYDIRAILLNLHAFMLILIFGQLYGESLAFETCFRIHSW